MAWGGGSRPFPFFTLHFAFYIRQRMVAAIGGDRPTQKCAVAVGNRLRAHLFTNERLGLISAARITLQNALKLLGVSAPESM